jgi:uncharacterized protein (DUF58 family)
VRRGGPRGEVPVHPADVVARLVEPPAGQLRAAARHDVVVVEVRDPRESELPPTGLLTLVDPETGRRLEVQTANPKIRKRFAEAAERQRTEHRRAVRAAGAAHLILSTDRDWLRDVISFVAQRRRLR